MGIEYLHTMVRVKDLDASKAFYELLGLVERRRREDEKGRFTLVFMAPPDRQDGTADVELTYNWDGDDGLPGDSRHFGHLAYRVDDIYAACQRLSERGQVANPVTLKALFDQDAVLSEIGGAQYLVDLAANAVTVINAEPTLFPAGAISIVRLGPLPPNVIESSGTSSRLSDLAVTTRFAAFVRASPTSRGIGPVAPPILISTRPGFLSSSSFFASFFLPPQWSRSRATAVPSSVSRTILPMCL